MRAVEQSFNEHKAKAKQEYDALKQKFDVIKEKKNDLFFQLRQKDRANTQSKLVNQGECQRSY